MVKPMAQEVKIRLTNNLNSQQVNALTYLRNNNAARAMMTYYIQVSKSPMTVFNSWVDENNLHDKPQYKFSYGVYTLFKDDCLVALNKKLAKATN